jgi:hypothetical protein
MVHEGGVPGLRAKTFKKSGVPKEFIFQNFDSDVSPNDRVGGLPHFAHTAHGDARFELVATAEVHAS